MPDSGSDASPSFSGGSTIEHMGAARAAARDHRTAGAGACARHAPAGSAASTSSSTAVGLVDGCIKVIVRAIRAG
eukprot:4203579-Prymnesium_polylepis.1